jgi:hypothetical protein
VVEWLLVVSFACRVLVTVSGGLDVPVPLVLFFYSLITISLNLRTD